MPLSTPRMPELEVIVTIGVDTVPASRADEVETAVVEALAALDPPVVCAAVRRVPLARAAAELDAAFGALPTAEQALPGVFAEVERRRGTAVDGA